MSALSRIEGFISFMAIALLRAYQVGISPMNPWHCKFHPTCSNYAVAAVRLHGPWLGAWLALKRLGRCRPGTFGGIDPVPDASESHPEGRLA